MSLKIYNSMTKQKEIFKPIEGNTVRLYSCGPTVYKDATIGNMKSFIFMDTLRRLLKFKKKDIFILIKKVVKKRIGNYGR